MEGGTLQPPNSIARSHKSKHRKRSDSLSPGKLHLARPFTLSREREATSPNTNKLDSLSANGSDGTLSRRERRRSTSRSTANAKGSSSGKSSRHTKRRASFRVEANPPQRHKTFTARVPCDGETVHSLSSDSTLPAHVQEALQRFKRTHAELNRPEPTYRPASFPEISDEVYNHEELFSTEHKFDELVSVKERPQILQAFSPVFKWDGGVEVSLCKRLPAKLLEGDSRHVQARVHMSFSGLSLEVGVNEPLFCEAYLYDPSLTDRVSESFYWNPTLKTKSRGLWSSKEVDASKKDKYIKAKDAIFSLPLGFKNVHVVVKIYKVLEGDPKIFIANYTNPSTKTAAAISDAAKGFCLRLRDFRQLLGFAVSPCYDQNKRFRENHIASNLSDIYRIPKQGESFSDEALNDAIVQLNDPKKPSKRIPGSLSVDCRVLPKVRASALNSFKSEKVLSPSLDIVGSPEIRRALREQARGKPSKHSAEDTVEAARLTSNGGSSTQLNGTKGSESPRSATSAASSVADSPSVPASKKTPTIDDGVADPIGRLSSKDTVVREILNFHADRPSKTIPPAMLSTNLECSNNLFIYPKSVAFEKYRNVAVRIQVKDRYEIKAPGIPLIHSRNDASHLVDEACTAVTYHSKSPVFTDEIKIELPRSLRASHHIFFTFYNVKVKIDKRAQNASAKEELGYCVLPLYVDGRVPDEVYSLPVFRSLDRHYVSQATDCSRGACYPMGKTLFRVNMRLASTLYTNDPFLSHFLSSCSFETPNREQREEDAKVDKTLAQALRMGSLKQQGTSTVGRLFGAESDRWIILQQPKADKPLQLVCSKMDLTDSQIFKLTPSHRIDMPERPNPKEPFMLLVTEDDEGAPQESLRHMSKRITRIRTGAVLDEEEKKSREWLDNRQLRLLSDSEDELRVWRNAIHAALIRQWNKSDSIKGIRKASADSVARFLPTIMGMLFRTVNTKVANEKDKQYIECRRSAFQALLYTCNILSQGANDERAQLLDSYVSQIFDDFHVSGGESDEWFYSHEAIVDLWVRLLTSRTSAEAIRMSLKHSWFLFDCIIKSLVLMLLRSGRTIECTFTDAKIQNSLRRLVEALCQAAVNNDEELSRIANSNLALFMRDLLYIMDRHFMFDMIALYLTRVSDLKTKASSANKFVFLELIFDHDLYLPLCRGSVLKSSSAAKKYFDVYNKQIEEMDPEVPRRTMDNITRQFFPQLLLSEIMHSFTHSTNSSFVLERAAYVFRKVLTKHDYDHFYQRDQARQLAAEMYIDFVPDLWSKLSQLNDRRQVSLDTRRELFVCFLYILKNVSHTYLSRYLINHKKRMYKHFERLELRQRQAVERGRGRSIERVNTGGSISHTQQESLSGISPVSTGTSVPGTPTSTGRETPNQSASSPASSEVGQDLFLDEQEITGMWFARFLDVLQDAQHVFEYPNRHKEPPNVVKTDVNSTILMPRLVPKMLDFNKNYRRSNSNSRLSTPRGRSTPSNLSRMLTMRYSVQEHIKLGMKNVPPDIIHKVRKWERVCATEVSNIILDITEHVLEPFFEKHLQEEDPIQQRFVDFMFNFMSCNLSNRVVCRTFQLLSRFLSKYSRLLFAHRKALIDAQGCERWWQALLERGCYRDSAPREASISFMYELLKACYDQIGSLTRILRPLSEAFQVVFDDSRNDVESMRSLKQMIHAMGRHAADDPELAKPHIMAFSNQVQEIFDKFRQIVQKVEAMEGEKNPDKSKAAEPHAEDLTDQILEVHDLYTHSPRMKIQMLGDLIKVHKRSGAGVEAALAHMEIANIMKSERSRQHYSFGVTATQKSIDGHLKTSSHLFMQAQMPERSMEILQDLINFYRQELTFSQIDACLLQMISVNKNISDYSAGTDIRIFGTYYRVGYYGTEFGEHHLKEYVYKEPMITQLNEIKTRLLNYWNPRLAQHQLRKPCEVYPDSREIKPESIVKGEPKIQITSVTPYSAIDEANKDNPSYVQQHEYNLHTNLGTLEYMTPFTKEGKAHGTTATQYKRRTILYLSDTFPCLRKRIRVARKVHVIQNPIECSFDELRKRIRILHSEINPKNGVVSLKTLSQVLAGSVVPTVHGGSKEICEVFLSPQNRVKWDENHVAQLRTLMHRFVEICHKAVSVYQFKLNQMSSTDKDRSFLDEMKKGFQQLLSNVGRDVFPEGAPRHLKRFPYGGIYKRL